jgi:penicillin-binding protein 2
MRRDQDRHRRLTRRALLLGAGQLGLFGLLGGRMYQLQVLESERYATLADDNRINVRLYPTPRGPIYDRWGLPLALNRQTYRVSVIPEEARDVTDTLGRLAALVPVSESDWMRVLETSRRQRAFVPITVLDNLSWEEMARVAVQLPDLPGVHVDEMQRRIYPEGTAAAHVVGYVGAAEVHELTGDPVLTLPDFRIGKSGAERVHDEALRGVATRSRVEVNAVGRVIRELSREEGEPGRPLSLTIDVELQRFVLDRFGEETGAAVILDVHTGEVLTMASSPSFDPNPFGRGISAEDWRALSTGEHAPLINKTIAGQYAPGSTFKMVVAAAALEHGVVTPGQSFFCNGVHRLGKGRFHCWRGGGHGWMAMHDAIVQSCDVYFYEVARRVGIDRIAEMAERLGLGRRLGIDLPNERAGLMPTRAWKRRVYNQAWHVGETVVAGIGQGFVLTTPLQLAVMAARLVNGGRAVTPHITRRVGDSGERALPVFEPIGVSPATLDIILRAMNAVTQDPRGTGRGAQIPVAELRMGGKTGTSQVRRITAKERRLGVARNEDRPREERDHALFVGYAPMSTPRWAMAVVVEHGGGGARVAAPIVRDGLLEVQTRDRARRSPTAGVPGSRVGSGGRG